MLGFEYPKGRGEILEIDGNTIIDDTYNANLNSMKAGIKELELIKGEKLISNPAGSERNLQPVAIFLFSKL